jgi:hypothetical protein
MLLNDNEIFWLTWLQNSDRGGDAAIFGYISFTIINK